MYDSELILYVHAAGAYNVIDENMRDTTKAESRETRLSKYLMKANCE